MRDLGRGLEQAPGGGRPDVGGRDSLSSWMGPRAQGRGAAAVAPRRKPARTGCPPGRSCRPARSRRFAAGSTPLSPASLRASGEILTRAAGSRGAGAAGLGAGAGAAAGEWAGAGAGGRRRGAARGAACGAAGAGAATFSPAFPTAHRAAPIGTGEPAGMKTREEDPVEEALKLHGRLVGLDLGQDVAGLDGSPSFLSHLTSVPTSSCR